MDVAEKYLGIERYMFSDTYNLFLKYRDIKEYDENAWQMLADDANKLYDKYKNHPMARNLISATLENLEFKQCKRVIEGKTYKDYEVELKDVNSIGF